MQKKIHIKDLLVLDSGDTLINNFTASAYSKIFWIEALRLPPEEQFRYHVYGIFHYSTPPDFLRLEMALQILVNTNYHLRTTFVEQNEALRQIIKHDQVAELTYYSVNHDEQFHTILKQAISQPFDLAQGPLFRFVLIFHEQTQITTFLPIFHHIILDGTQFDALMDRIGCYYHHPIDLDSRDTAELNILKEYLLEEKELIKKSNVQFWIDNLNQYPLQIHFPPSCYGARNKAEAVHQLYLLEQELYVRLKHFSLQNKVSLFHILKAVWAILISMYANQEELVISFPVNMRGKKYIQLKGAFVNTPFYFFERVGTFLEYVMTEKENSDLRNHWAVSRIDIISALKEKSHDFAVSFAQSDLFIYGPVLDATPESMSHRLVGGLGGAKLGFFYQEKENVLHYGLIGFPEWVDEALLKQMHQHFDILLEKVLTEPTLSLKTLSCLSDEEHNTITSRWNKTEPRYPTNKTIHELFEEQSAKMPDQIALVCEERKLTYRELNEKANQLAHYLKKTYTIKADNLIAVCLERSEQMVISFLAILKSGGAYVPISSRHLDDHNCYLFDESSIKMIITHQAHKNKFTNEVSALFLETQETQKLLSMQPVINLDHSRSANHHLAYVIYTSGTTAKPKGVMIEHRNVVSLTKKPGYLTVCREHAIVQLADIAFDAATFEIYTALLNGATLFIPKDTLSLFAYPEHFKNYLVENKINILWLTKTLFDQLYLSSKNIFNTIEYLLIGGEPLNYALVQALLKSPDKPKHLLNGYGPTESTTFSTVYPVSEDDIINLRSIPIGKAICGRTGYILDRHLNLLPIGAIGELYVGGAGLARGYLKQPQLTDEKFIANPFQENDRLYNTGDLARYLPGGNIEYIGRNDGQVKIRGYRVELTEIEKKLLDYPEIKQAVVLAFEQKTSYSKYLVGYYVADHALDHNAIVVTLEKSLPDYMVPSILVHVKSFPLTTNGKLNIKVLPQPAWSDADNFVAPRNAIEKQLCGIYAEIFSLPYECISIRANFFALGGNSILAIQLAHRLSRMLDVYLPIAEIFRAKTIEALAKFIETITTKKMIIPAAEASMNYPLSFAQESLCFIEQYEHGEGAYHIPNVLRLSEDISLSALTQALQSIVERHEILRTFFIQDDTGKYFQCIQKTPLTISTLSCKTWDEYQQYLNEDVNRRFNLSTEYPVRVCLYEVVENKAHYLLVNMHHIASDGWSIDIFQKELLAYYEYYHLNKLFFLPTLLIQYKDFAVWQRNDFSADRFEKQLNYWRARLADCETLYLAIDKPRPSQLSYAATTFPFVLSSELSIQLRGFAQSHGYTLYTILLAGFYVLLNQYSGQEDIMLGTPMTNRSHEATQDLIGFFVNMWVQREQLDVHQSIVQLMAQIHQHLIEAQQNQDIPFEHLVQAIGEERDTSRHALFQVTFAVQNFGQKNEAFAQYFHQINIVQPMTACDLGCLIDDSQSTLRGMMLYDENLFTESTLERFANNYMAILSQMVNDTDKPLKAYDILALEEYQEIVYGWNLPDNSYTIDKSISEIFEAQVERTPDNIAIVYENNSLTYNELNQRANQLAHYLKRFHVSIETPVGIFMERSVDMIIGILGVLKAGGACVPLDIAEPHERLLAILDDTKLSIILVDEKSNRLVDLSSDLIFCDVTQKFLEPTQNITRHHNINYLAFLVYTSGSTGVPKGVMLSHRTFSRCEYWAKDVFCFTSTDKFLFKSIRAPEEFLFPLFIGASLVIAPPNAEIDPALFVRTILKNKITVANFTPSFLHVLLGHIGLEENVDLKHVFCAGEFLSVELQNQFFSRLSAYLYNFYGLAEAPYTTYRKYDKPEIMSLIGRAVDAKVYILNSMRQPVPIGVIGELYVGGIGLAHGYLNRPELMAERFIPNPFDKETYLYKTGDLARYFTDGNIEYIGRKDFQVKVRGFRVELGEIEHRLLQYPGIKQAVVLAQQHQKNSIYQYLVGYYVADTILDEADILNYLSRYLPDYMIPAVLVYLEKFPLNVNGKLNRKALPQARREKIDIYVPPCNIIEQQICDMYAEMFSVNSIGAQSNFFQLGGNSLLAIQMAHRLSRRFNIHFQVSEIFRSKTISQLAKSIETITTKNIIIPPANELTHYPLSFAQERLWFIEQYEEGTSAYHLPRLVKLKKDVSLDAVMQAFQSIVARHEILRSLFSQDETGKEYQLIQKTLLNIQIRSCKTWNECKQYLTDDINKPFDLRSEFPIRICVYTVRDAKENYLLVNMHHIASDGWSTDIFQQELISYYEHYHFNKPLSLPNLPIQYKDFAMWQREYLSGTELEKQLTYWSKRLSGYEPLHLATDKPRTTEVGYAGANLTFHFTSQLSTQLRTFAKMHGYSIYTVLLAGFYVLLNKYSGQKDIILGSPIANRHYEITKDSIGFFVNMLLHREQLNTDLSVTHLMDQIHQHLIEAHQHQDIPFERLIQELNVVRDISRHPLFQVMFAVQSFGQKEGQYARYYDVVDITKLHAVTRFDLEFSIDDSSSNFQGMVTYATNLFYESTMRRWVEHYKNILTQMMEESSKRLSMYQVLSAMEYQQLIYDWNHTEQNYPQQKMIHQLFEEQAQRTPNHIALVYQDVKLTYKKLNERANQLAHYLRKRYAIEGDDLIALCIERSCDMIITILGVLKSGAAYVPIDPAYPEERICYILHDAQAKVVITQQNCLAISEKFKCDFSTLIIDSEETCQLLKQQNFANVHSVGNAQQLAYVIYTSGTTGKPKGVMVEHRSVINTLFALKKVYDFKASEKSAAFTHYVFDVSVSEFFSALLNGGELHLLSEATRKDVGLLSAYLQSQSIHYVYLPPALLSLLPKIDYKYLRGIIYAGEVCDVSTGSYWSRACKLFNYYGPTETSIYALGKQVIQGDVHLIGKPIANMRVYVLDNDLNPVPLGVIGELHIAGVGLARGYLNHSELTAEKFIVNPFQKNAYLYKTGDLVRYLPDGNIEYVGRKDFQVKIRGFRVELGEIEHQLLQYPRIKQASVLVQQHQKKSSIHQYLVGYYVADIALDEDDILDYLSRHLPEYMIPNTLVPLEKLPLNINGKLDRQALPQPAWKNMGDYLAPRNVIEEYICDIYAEMFSLPADSISVQENFFRLGGNSLLAIQVAHRLSRRFDVHFPIAEIFRTKTIAQLAKSIETLTTKNIIIPRAEELAYYPLSFSQERLWFIEQYEQGTAAYHMPRLAKLTEGVSLEALTQALKSIVARHEVLRTLFVQDVLGKDYQWVRDEPLNIHIRSCKTFDEYQQYLKDDVNTPFDLRSEYPIRICLYNVLELNERYLLVNMHHIASDGWSIDIFQKEVVAYYEHYHFNKPLSLPNLFIQYKDFAVWQKRRLSGDKFEKQLTYWQNRLANYEMLQLPMSKPRPARLSYEGNTFFFYFTEELSSQLRAFAQKHEFSLYVVLLSGFYLLMHQCSGQKDIMLGTPVANRHYESLKDLIGSCVNVIAQREHLDVEKSIIYLMTQVHQHLIDAQRYQDIPFEQLIQKLNVERDISRHPLFQVMFSVQSFGLKEEKFAHYLESVDITDIHPITRFDISCFISTAKSTFKGLISYATHLFDESVMQQLLQHYIHILTQMLNVPNQSLDAYQVISGWDQIKQHSSVDRFPNKAEVVCVAPRDEFERKIGRVFSEILALSMDSINVCADFFQLGGNSVLAMQLASRLSQCVGQDFSITEIFRSRTIEKLAKSLQKISFPLEIENFIVPLREADPKHPLFIISGGHGEGFISFMPIVDSLKFDGSIYGIRSRVFDPHWTIPKTLREQAEAVFKSIRKIQPKGPYYFLGACIGGSLAVQLQQLAEEARETPGVVFLINSRPLFNQPFDLTSETILVKVKNYYYRLKEFHLTSKATFFSKVKYIFKRGYLEIYHGVLAKSEKYYRLLYSGDPVWLQSELHLLLSSDENTPELTFNNWKSFFDKDVYLYPLNGTHASIYTEESAAIAAIIDESLLDLF